MKNPRFKKGDEVIWLGDAFVVKGAFWHELRECWYYWVQASKDCTLPDAAPEDELTLWPKGKR